LTRCRGTMPSPCFPPTVCDKVPSFPLTGSLGKVRPLHWYYEDTPTSAARLAGSLRSPGNTYVAPCPSLPPVKDALPEDQGPSCSATPVPIKRKRRRRQTSQVPGEPFVTVCLGLRPRWDRHARPLRRADTAPGGSTARAPDEKTFEAQCPGFPSDCLRFAAWIAPGPRKTRFRLLASSTGRDSDPQGSDGRFPSCTRYISSPFPRLGLAQ
jgi:hypothetical protein